MLLNPVFINMLMVGGPVDFNHVKDSVARGLWVSIKYARSKCVYVTPTKVLELGKSPYIHHPRTKTLADYILNTLCQCGLMEFYGVRAKRKIYCVRENSPLWNAIKRSEGPEDILKFIEEVIEQ